MTLRSKLIFSFMAFASLLLLVGLTSLYLNRVVQADVADLRASRGVDFRQLDITNVGLEIEGFWDPGGTFVARDARVVPGGRRPKLRGAIQDIDSGKRTITLYGVQVSVSPETDFIGTGSVQQLDDLKLGQRIEVSGSVVGGRWAARKIKTQNVKASDKIKGTATSAELDGEAPETIWLHGIEVTISPPSNTSPNGALRRIELATQMTLLLQESRAEAHRLVRRKLVPNGIPDIDVNRDADPTAVADEQLVRHEQSFEYYLEQSQLADGVQSAALTPLLHQLMAMQAPLREHVETLRDLADNDAIGARAFLDVEFDPFVQDDLLPIVYAYRTGLAIENAHGKPLGVVVPPVTGGRRFRILSADGRATLFELHREPDGDLEVADGSGKIINEAKRRAYGFKVFDGNDDPVSKIRLTENKISLRDVSGATFLATRDQLPAESVAAIAFEGMRFEFATALSVAIAHWGEPAE